MCAVRYLFFSVRVLVVWVIMFTFLAVYTHFAHADDSDAYPRMTFSAINDGTLARTADHIRSELRKLQPGYVIVEEAASEIARDWSEWARTEILGPALAEWIRASRREAIDAGVDGVPIWVQDSLSGLVDVKLLEGTRFRVGRGNELALPAIAQLFAGARAIALDDVIVFLDREDLQDLPLWAHELHHVDQYRRWGVDGFAERYVRDFNGVEAEAEQAARKLRR